MKEARILVAIRNDDPSAAMNLEHERQVFEIFEHFGAPQTIAVIPRVALNLKDRSVSKTYSLSENPEAVAFLKNHVEQNGSEIALHGYTHQINRFSIPARKEFSEFKYLPFEEQDEMIRAGVRIVEECLGVRPVTFVPPWNRCDHNTIKACVRNRIQIVSAGRHIAVENGIFAIGTNTTLDAFQHDFEEAKASSAIVFLNVLMHSATITPEQKQLLISVLETASQDRECQIVTIQELAKRYPGEVRSMNEAGCAVVPGFQVPGTIRARAWPYIVGATKIGVNGKVNKTHARAREFYGRGYYEECRRLGMEAERISQTYLLVGRFLTFCVGTSFGWCAAVLVASRRIEPKVNCVVAAAFSMAVLVVATVAARKPITNDVRKELRFAAFALSAGVLIGWVGRALFK